MKGGLSMDFMISKNDKAVLRVVYDNDPESPRNWDGNVGTMTCWHRRYNLGDSHNFDDSADLFESLIWDVLDAKLRKKIVQYVNQGKSASVRLGYNRSTNEWVQSSLWSGEWLKTCSFPAPLNYKDNSLLQSIMEDLDVKDLLYFVKDYYVILPVYIYDHSGITLNTVGFSDPWDSGQVGWIYASKGKFLKETGYTKNELFSTDPHRKPKVGERVKINSRGDFGQVKKISDGKVVVDFDYNKALDYRKPENVVTVPLTDIAEVLANRAEEMLREEVEVYDQYVRGDVYGFILETPEGELMDSCYGFYGNDFKENGMLDYIPDEYADLVDKLQPVF